MTGPLAIPSASLAGLSGLSGDALSLAAPGASVGDVLGALQDGGFSHEALPLLSEALPDRERTWWAAQAAKRASTQGSPSEAAAIEAAESWAKAPSEAGAQAAATAATQAGFGGPAGWAAQSAAWAEPAIAGDAGGLCRHAADGALQLAMASDGGTLPAAPAASASREAPPPVSPGETDPPRGSPPATAPSQQLSAEDRARLSTLAAPYLEMGLQIASGGVPW